jgi:hypothetical protein
LFVPDAVEHLSIRKYSDVDIVHEDIMEMSDFLVPEKRIRHPDLKRKLL